MNKIKALISEHVLLVRANHPEQFNPIGLSQLRREISSGIEEIVTRVGQLPDTIVRPLIRDAFIGSKAHSFAFAIKAMKANGRTNAQIVDFVFETDQLLITEDDAGKRISVSCR